MTRTRQITVMMNMDWPVKHHYEVFAGIQRYERECGRWECSTDPYPELLLSGTGPEKPPDGIIGRITPHVADLAAQSGVPVVNVWLNSPVTAVASVTHDAEGSGRMAAQHLIERGFRRFGFLGFVNDRTSQLQLTGFRQTLAKHDFPCLARRVSYRYEESLSQWRRCRAKLLHWIDQWETPIAVFVSHDVICRYLADLCLRQHLRLPGDVSLVSSYNEPIVAAYTKPALSSIDFGFEAIGYRAAALLDQMIDGAPKPEAPIRVAPAGLVVRESSQPFAVDDPIVARAVQFIVEHLHEQIGVEEVADHLFVSRQTLLRLFRRVLGQTVHETIARLRLERVKQRLLEPSAVLKSVAEECGFRDAIHMYKVFQHAEGVSPSEYRATRATGCDDDS